MSYVMQSIASLRTGPTPGLLTCLFGVTLIGFGTFAILMVALQRTLFVAMPEIPQDKTGVAFTKAMDAVHHLWLIYMPLMIAGGIVFAVAGFQLLHGSLLARRVAQVNAVLGYAWLLGYAIGCQRVMPLMLSMFDEFPRTPIDMKTFAWISLIGTSVITAMFPTALLWILAQPSQSTSAAKTERE